MPPLPQQLPPPPTCSPCSHMRLLSHMHPLDTEGEKVNGYNSTLRAAISRESPTKHGGGDGNTLGRVESGVVTPPSRPRAVNGL